MTYCNEIDETLRELQAAKTPMARLAVLQARCQTARGHYATPGRTSWGPACYEVNLYGVHATGDAPEELIRNWQAVARRSLAGLVNAIDEDLAAQVREASRIVMDPGTTPDIIFQRAVETVSKNPHLAASAALRIVAMLPKSAA